MTFLQNTELYNHTIPQGVGLLAVGGHLWLLSSQKLDITNGDEWLEKDRSATSSSSHQ